MSNLEQIMARDYEIVVRNVKGVFYARANGVQLVGTGVTLMAAHANLLDAMRTHFQSYIDMGEVNDIPLPHLDEERRVIARSMKPFLLKAVIVAFIGALLIVSANLSIIYTLRETPKHLAQTAGRAFIHQFINKLDKFAKEEITPSRDEKIHSAIRAAVPRLKPYVRDLAPLFNEVTSESINHGQ